MLTSLTDTFNFLREILFPRSCDNDSDDLTIRETLSVSQMTSCRIKKLANLTPALGVLPFTVSIVVQKLTKKYQTVSKMVKKDKNSSKN